MELYNIEAEQSILGAILIEPQSITEGSQVNLSASDFYIEKHQIIYNCMKKLYSSNFEIDLVILSSELRNDNTLDAVGGVAYMSSLITIVPTASNILYYMKIVKTLAMKRYIHNELLQTGSNIQSMDTNDLINFTDELKSMLLESSHVEDLFIDASTISLKTENAGAIETGFKNLDNVTGGGLNFGTLTIITGEPGSGKSTFLNQILANALSLGFNGFLYSGELTYQMLMEWFCKTVANPKHLITCTNNFGKYVKLSDEGFEMISNWTKDKLFIYSKEAKADETNLANVIEYLAIKKNVKLFILDNLMTLECSGSDKYEKQIIAVKALKNLAKKYNLALILVAHSNKSSLLNRESHVFEISGASEIPNLADYVFKTSREDGEPLTHVLVLKNRITGIIKKRAILKFDSNRKRFFTKDDTELNKDFGYEPQYEQGSFC
ncbi:DnaB-like helicase N-terminal domain-containing protein [Intestinibacter bartlettii]|uniref:AAA family ATPase n=1 Tax=Intestinibacter bartlettii TaxID=261299 RepID=A0ABS6DUF6_9FIRM|nr:DnaB-like helicase N-terminal domain-containing protein [Intestinibacter bartlettii]MBU5335473.1 AAA family ATPase [Intestinibacter bartlettii]